MKRKEHAEIADMMRQGRFADVLDKVSESYGKTSKPAMLAARACVAISKLRCQMDDVACSEGHEDAERIYYGNK